MKLNSSLGIVVMIGTFFLSFGVNQATSNRTKIYFGLRQDADPISYKDGVGNWQGYCNAFIEVLKEKAGLNIEIVPIEGKHRFTGIGSNGQKLDAECGADTITRGRQSKELKENNRNGKFSEPFASTGAKTLVSDEKKLYFINNNRPEIQKLKLGVIKGTTTRILVEAKYPSSFNIIVLKDKADAIKQMKDGTIDVYFNDELILIEMVKSLKSLNNHKEYSILPELLTYEDYGIVVFHVEQDENRLLLEKINNFLTTVGFQSFGDTKIKLFDTPEFDKFKKDISPPVNSPVKSQVISQANSLSFYFYAFLIIILFIIVMFIIIRNPVIINNIFHPKNNGFSVGGSVEGDVKNNQGDNNRTAQGDNNQASLGDGNKVKQKNQ